MENISLMTKNEREARAQGFTGTVTETYARDISHLIVFSFLGAFLRGGLDDLFSKVWHVTNPLGSTFTDIAPNFLGSFFMGIFVPSQPKVISLSSSLSLGLSTGFFGSLTTWSAWQLQAVEMFSLGYVASAFWCLIIGFCIAAGGYIMGEHVFESWIQPQLANDSNQSRDSKTPLDQYRISQIMRKRVDQINHKVTLVVFVVLSILFYTISAVLLYFSIQYINNEDGNNNQQDLTTWLSVRHYCITLMLAPLGTILRWQLGVRINPFIKLFPFGTFLANVISTLIDVALASANLIYYQQVGIDNWIYSGVISGFCGCLSTVSTWIAEQFAAQSIFDQYIYALISFGTCQILGIAIYLSTYEYSCKNSNCKI